MIDNPEMQNDKPENKPVDTPSAAVAVENKNILENLKEEVKELFSLHLDTDETGTVESIKKSIEFQGGNLWALIFAAFIASIGLNVNSGAVVIGAMLISPLMGPIVGIGFSIATNDFDTLKNALRNLAIFVVVSITASALYFMVSPLKTLTDQLEARTYPTFYDVLIAICGGAIGIVASSRADRGNAIPGVAIATALMPPLCTVGYGLATLHLNFAAGALYLFFINSVFIAGTAWVFVRALNFKKKVFINPDREQRYKTIMLVIVVVTILPSIYTAYTVVQHEIFNSKAAQFSEKAKIYQFEKGLIIGNPEPDYRRDTPAIKLTVMGGVTQHDRDNLKNILKDVGLPEAQILFREGSGYDSELLLKELTDLRTRFMSMSDEYTSLIEDLYTDKKNLLNDKNKRIEFLESELAKHNQEHHRTSKPVDAVAKEFSALFPEAQEVSYSELVKMNTKTQKLDTLPTVVLNWKGRSMSRSQREKISNYFIQRLELDTIEVIVH